MIRAGKTKPSLECLIENEDLGIEILHPGGLELTAELAGLCSIGKNAVVLDVASGTGESAYYLAEVLGARVVGIDVSDAGKGAPMISIKNGLILTVIFLLASVCTVYADDSKLVTYQDRKSYKIGVHLVQALSKSGGEINLDIVIKGMQDALRGENQLGADDKKQLTMSAGRRPINKNGPQIAEIGHSSPVAAARMTIDGGAGRIKASSGQPVKRVGPNGYRYQGAGKITYERDE